MSKNTVNSFNMNQTAWNIMAGQFTANKTGIATISLSELNFKKQISWKFHLDDQS
jgi:hypothetical protein